MAAKDRPNCPSLIEYAQAELGMAIGELYILPEGSIIEQLLTDYSVMRAQCRPIGAMPSGSAAPLSSRRDE